MKLPCRVALGLLLAESFMLAGCGRTVPEAPRPHAAARARALAPAPAGAGEAAAESLHPSPPERPVFDPPPLHDFDNEPRTDPKAIALTFDDAPDCKGTLATILDELHAAHVRATFFVNTSNYCNVQTSSAAQDVLQRVVREGHQLGNHSAHHRHLARLSDADVDREFADEEAVLRDHHIGAPMTLLRTPYGEPDTQNPNQLRRIEPIIARHGVPVGWSIDSHDWSCESAQCVHDHVMEAVDHGHWGVVLLHATYATTAAALPQLIDELRQRGYHFVRVEDVVRAKYGMGSAALLRRWRASIKASVHAH